MLLFGSFLSPRLLISNWSTIEKTTILAFPFLSCVFDKFKFKFSLCVLFQHAPTHLSSRSRWYVFTHQRWWIERRLWISAVTDSEPIWCIPALFGLAEASWAWAVDFTRLRVITSAANSVSSQFWLRYELTGLVGANWGWAEVRFPNPLPSKGTCLHEQLLCKYWQDST